MSVYEHHYAARCTVQTAQRNSSRSTTAHAVSHDSARGYEESRNLLRKKRQQRRVQRIFNPVPSHHRYGHGQMPDIGPRARTRHHHLVYLPRRAQSIQIRPKYAAAQKHANDYRNPFHPTVFKKSSICARHCCGVNESAHRRSTGHIPVPARLIICGTTAAHCTSMSAFRTSPAPSGSRHGHIRR